MLAVVVPQFLDFNPDCSGAKASTYFNIFISHSDVVSVGTQIFRSSHHSELDGSLVAKGLVCPFSNWANLFDGGNTVVSDKNLMKSVFQSLQPNQLNVTYRCDDGVTIVSGNKVFDLAWRGKIQSVTTDEMWSQFVLSSVRAAVAVRICSCSSHVVFGQKDPPKHRERESDRALGMVLRDRRLCTTRVCRIPASQILAR